jgi:hypothetical protein
MFRRAHVVFGTLALMGAACGDPISNFVSRAATVRLVNDTDTPLSLANRGSLDSANTRLVFGQASTCMFVEVSGATVPPLTLTNAATSALITFTPNLTAGVNLTIVAFADTVGEVRLAALGNGFVPAANDAGLRFFNGASNTGAILMQRGGVVLTPSIEFGSASGFVSVPIDSARITFSNRSSVVLDAGLMAFPVGQNATVFVGPAAGGDESVPVFQRPGLLNTAAFLDRVAEGN